MKACRPALLSLALLIPLSGSASGLLIHGFGGAAYSVPVSSMKDVKFKNTVRQKYDFSCGAAALATLLTYQYGYRLTEEEAFQAMYAQGDQQKIQRDGFSLLDIKRFLNARGFKADGFRASLQDLAEAGLPAIVMINEKGYQHFVVIKGLRDNRVLFSDPAVGERTLPLPQFEQIWKNRLLFVIHSHKDLASFNSNAEWRFVPTAPLDVGISREGLLPAQRLGPGEF